MEWFIGKIKVIGISSEGNSVAPNLDNEIEEGRAQWAMASLFLLP
jgi:hypothetical protein